MLEQVRRTIEEYHMAKGGRLIVGLSGGADSVCLLHVLRQLVPRYGWDLQAVHIHHGLRGEEADRDAAFAMGFAQSLGVPCQVVSFDVAAEARKQGRSTEEFCGMKPLRSWQEKMGRSPLLIMPTIRRKLCSCVFAEVRGFLV